MSAERKPYMVRPTGRGLSHADVVDRATGVVVGRVWRGSHRDWWWPMRGERRLPRERTRADAARAVWEAAS